MSNAQAGIQRAAADVAAAAANTQVARQNTARAKTEAEDARQKLERRQSLLKSGAVSAEERETAQTNYNTASSAFETAGAQEQAAQAQHEAAAAALNASRTQELSAEAAAKQSEANLRNARINLDHTYIRAPVDGTVVSRKVDVGQTVAASMQAPTLFEIAQDLTRMQVDTSVDEADIGRVRVGQAARFTVDAYPGQPFRGEVREIRKAPVNVQNVVTYDVVISVDNPELKLFPGMTANVSILVERKSNVVRIPNAALRFTPSGSKRDSPRDATKSGTRTVWVPDKEGIARAVAIRAGISDGSYTEVISGLAARTAVIVGESVKPATTTAPRGPGF